MKMAESLDMEALAGEAHVEPRQARQIAISVLRELHRVAMQDDRGLTASLLDAYLKIGAEACYHLTGLLEEQRLSHDQEISWHETLLRLDSNFLRFRSIVEEWMAPETEA
jgi:hypothetical protein